MDEGLLIVISGFSGAGKGTIVRELLKTGRFWLSVSATTRAPREHEENGREYYFMSKEEFRERVEQNRFLEWAEFSGNYYGTPKDYALQHMAEGTDVILEIEAQGALQIKKQFPHAELIFLTPPSMAELAARLRGRGTETEAQIASRLAQARREVEQMHLYDYIVINDTVEACTGRVLGIISARHQSADRRRPLIDSLREEARELDF